MTSSALCFAIAAFSLAVSAAEKHGGHVHGIHDDAVMMNEDHIKSHLSKDYGINKDPSDMTKSEREFYEFKSHDFDENNQLDGLEMLKAMTHYDLVDANFLTEDEKRRLTPAQIMEKRNRILTEKQDSMEKEIDHIMDEHDVDKNGYISYAEYLLARWKDEE